MIDDDTIGLIIHKLLTFRSEKFMIDFMQSIGNSKHLNMKMNWEYVFNKFSFIEHHGVTSASPARYKRVETPIILQATCQYLYDFMKLILSNKQYNCNVNRVNEDGHTSLLITACDYREEAVEIGELLLQYDADVNQAGKTSDTTPNRPCAAIVNAACKSVIYSGGTGDLLKLHSDKPKKQEINVL